MVICPNCKRQLNGSPRRCGYCGESLVGDYFSRQNRPEPEPRGGLAGAGATAAMTLGVFGSIALLAALAFHMTPLFGYGAPPEVNTFWWGQTLVMTLPPVIYLVQICVLRGLRFSLLFDSVWLFVSACGLSVVAQAYIERGGGPFGGITAIPYLLTVGCSLVLAASVTGILSYRK